jgi:cob(I)alamin adenosyltransferase
MEARPEWLVRMDGSAVERLEAEIDEMDHVLEPLRNFILPGGTTAAAHLHIARTVCRRAERMVVAVGEHEAINSHALHYLNRLSDWLFTTARFENQQAGISEEKWYAG